MNVVIASISMEPRFRVELSSAFNEQFNVSFWDRCLSTTATIDEQNIRFFCFTG